MCISINICIYMIVIIFLFVCWVDFLVFFFKFLKLSIEEIVNYIIDKYFFMYEMIKKLLFNWMCYVYLWIIFWFNVKDSVYM